MGDFFDFSGFPARWHCGDWSSTLGWLTIISDLAIFASYMAIPVVIALYLRSKRDVPFPHLFWLFSAFIFACGTTHLIEAVIFWYPIYPVQGVLKLFTALVSMAAVVATVRIMPKALLLPGLAAMNQRLQAEITVRTQTQSELLRRSDALSRSERRLLAAQAAARIGDWSYLPQTQEVTWSNQVYLLFGRDPALGPPKNMAENLALYTPEGALALNAMMAEIYQGADRCESDLEVKHGQGSVVWHHGIVHAERDADGTITHLWGTVQDVTREKVAALAQLERSLQLERINRDLEQFAYIASHDLLEPLRKIRFFSDMVAAESHGRLSAEGEDALRRMGHASERMTRLVKDLLAFARAGKSLTSTDRVELATVLREAIENCEAGLRDSQGTVSVGPLPDVRGEQQLLTQVFQNLIANSIRYRHPERPPHIVVTATVLTDQAEMVRISIRDNGLGLPDTSGRLFEPFVRLHPEVVNNGTGIGLAICRRIVEAHGGQIIVSPNIAPGAEFIVTLQHWKPIHHGP